MISKSLSETHPDLALEANGWNPDNFSAGSGQKVKWLCSLNHEWSAKIVNRTKFSNQCPYCTNTKILKGFNDLQTKFPEIAKEAFGWDPSSVLPKVSTKMNWKCRLGHIWNASINNRTYNRNGCPYCLNRKVLQGFNDLATTHPKIAAEAYGWDSTSSHAGSTKSRKWICSSGHIWSASPKFRTENSNLNSQCRKCPSVKRQRSSYISGVNDLLTIAPEIATQAHGWDPGTVHAGSDKKLEWICAVGHTWHASPSARLQRNNTKINGCPYCLNRKVLQGFNDLATTHPEIAAEAYGWDPKLVVSGSEKKMSWRCSLSHEWINSPFNRTRGQESPCPFCSGRKVWPGFNDLVTTHPEIAKQANGWDPKKYSARQRISLSWKCSFEHEWKISPYSRVYQQTGCPYCSNIKLLRGFNDLATTHPTIASEAFGWDPSIFIAGRRVKKKWKCENGHVWEALISARKSDESGEGTGCPSCSKSGFDPNLDGYLYLIHHESWQRYAIGITNKPHQRLKSHESIGWEVLEIKGPLDGLLTQQWETSILQMLRAKGIRVIPKTQINFTNPNSVGGESWQSHQFEPNSINQILSMMRSFEENGVIE